MNYLPGIFLLLTLSMIGCGTVSEENDGASILLKHAMEAHGGIDSFDELQSLNYQKTTILYDSSGQVESTLVQDHTYHFAPKQKGSIKWSQHGSAYQIDYSDGLATLSIDQVAQPEQDASSLNSVNAAHFVLLQPFKLADKGVRVIEGTKRHLFDGQDYPVLHPQYDGDSGDQWWFYIHPSDHMVIANLVLHNKRLSFIENIAFDSTTGIVFHKHRKSYFTDSTFSMKMLRAEYFYDHYSIKSQPE